MFHNGSHVLEPPDVMDCRAEVKSLENIRQGVEAYHLLGALGHDGTEGLEARQ